ncbi:MAG: TatD family hydrolase [bacterium]|nr:TatD family hydrolase [bacterium]
MIDTHCHLDRCDDLAAALDHDLDAVITIGTDQARLGPALRLAEHDRRTFAVVGIHPNEAHEVRDPAARAAVEAALAHPRVVGVGETGIDLYWDRAPLELQVESFRWQGALAAARDLPLVLHVRDPKGGSGAVADRASGLSADLLTEIGHARGVLHCTNGHPELLRVALALGWYVSFAGNLTYPKATAVRDAARLVPAERLLVETDAPFLAPVPHRGRSNLPAYVRHTAAELARLRGVEPAALEQRLDANARTLFRLPERAAADGEGAVAG